MTTCRKIFRGRLLPALLLAMGMALAGCGGDEEPATSAAPATANASSSGTAASSTPGTASPSGSSSSSDSAQPVTPAVNPPASVVATPVNRAPTLTGTAQAATAIGTAYVFAPVAADADGDTLTFSIANKPSWATFNTLTGRLSGTPTLANVGTSAGIVIAVSDGKTTTSLSPFSITVNQIATGQASLSWTPPTQNTDGSSLTNLSGFKIYYGTNANALTQSITLNNASISTYLVENLSPATWYFAVKAVASGIESDLSNVASKTIS